MRLSLRSRRAAQHDLDARSVTDAADGGGAIDNPAVGADTGTEWVDVAAVADVTDRLVVDLAGLPVLVVRTGRGFVAVEDRCPHLAQRLSAGRIEGRQIQCPSHGFRWDLESGRSVRCTGPARQGPLRRVAMRVADGRLLLGLPIDERASTAGSRCATRSR